MKWHDAREVIPVETEPVLIQGHYDLALAYSGRWLTNCGCYYNFEELPYWLYLDEVFEEIDSDD